MKLDTHAEQDPELSAVLEFWREEATLPPRFEEGVWRRIALGREAAGSRSGFWWAVLAHWEALVRKPLGIAACMATFVALGLGLGLWHAQTFTARAETAWQHAYFQSVSPTTATSMP